MRPFAGQTAVIDSQAMPMSQICESLKCGKVCRVCDRKFFLRAVYQEYANEMIKLD